MRQEDRGLQAFVGVVGSATPKIHRNVHSVSRKSITSMLPLSLATSMGRQFLLSLAFGSARYWTSKRTVSVKPVLAASWSGVAPVLRSLTLGSAPNFSSNCATGRLPIIITCSAVRPNWFTPLTSAPLSRRCSTAAVFPVAAAVVKSSSRVMTKINVKLSSAVVDERAQIKDVL